MFDVEIVEYLKHLNYISILKIVLNVPSFTRTFKLVLHLCSEPVDPLLLLFIDSNPLTIRLADFVMQVAVQKEEEKRKRVLRYFLSASYASVLLHQKSAKQTLSWSPLYGKDPS